jgi:hypothetical protein
MRSRLTGAISRAKLGKIVRGLVMLDGIAMDWSFDEGRKEG